MPDDPPAPALTVRVLDVGQGDAILIHSGASRVLIDGGPDPERLGALLDSLGLDGATFDAVILTHQHLDHYAGLQELFASRRHIQVRTFFEDGDATPRGALDALRDSVLARADRGLLDYRDTDDPCGDGRPVCVVPLAGGAHLDVLAPAPGAGRTGANDRSVAVKLVGADSASFTMWLAGDAERAAIDRFERAGYAADPGMAADVLKADHHGSCNGVSARYLELVHPALVVASLAAGNDYGHMHTQAKALYTAAGAPWLRTDRNGTITITTAGTPGSGYVATPSRPGQSLSGPGDRRSRQPDCAG